MNAKEFIKKVGKCPREVYWSSLQLDSEKSFHFAKMVAFREIVKEFSWENMKDYDAVRDRLNQYIDDSMFYLQKEKESHIASLITSIQVFADYMREEELEGSVVEVCTKPLKTDMKEILGDDIYSSPDFLITKPDGRIVALLIKSKKDRITGPDAEVEAYFLNHNETTPLSCIQYYFVKEHKFQSKALGVKGMDYIKEAKNLFPSPFAQITDASLCEKCIYRKLCIFEDIDTKGDELKARDVVKRKVQWTDEQSAIIAAHQGEIRVLAGAGSGKTSVLTQRMIELSKKTAANRILAITFTKAGVEEIKSKIAEKGGDPTQFQIMTFNGFCSELLSRDYKEYGFNTPPRLIDPEESARIVGDLLDKESTIVGLNYQYPFMRFGYVLGAVAATQDLLSRWKRRHVTSSDGITADLIGDKKYEKLINNAFANQSEIFERILKAYNNYLLDHALVDYDDQINFVLNKVKTDDDYARCIGRQYDHIIIDEFQDTSDDQLKLFQRIYEPSNHTSLLVCGDDAQSIFKFRDVDARNIIYFERYFPRAITMQLTKNFRSTQNILDAATEIIRKSPENLNKDLVASLKKRGNITYLQRLNSDVVKEIEKAVANRVTLGDIAILCPTRAMCNEYHVYLKSMGIDSVIVVGNNIKEDNQVQAMIALSKFLDERSNGDAHLFDLTVWLHKSDPTVFENQFTMKDFITGEYSLLIDEWSNIEENKRYDWFVNKIESVFPSKSVGLQMVFDRETEIGDKDIDRLFDFLKNVENGRINIYTPSVETPYDAVTISTIHAAKGKEWHTVIVDTNGLKCQVVKNKEASTKDFPVYDKIVEPEVYRLLFVAITRAKENLIILLSDKTFDAEFFGVQNV